MDKGLTLQKLSPVTAEAAAGHSAQKVLVCHSTKQAHKHLPFQDIWAFIF
jgi:hypothetical protein